MVEGQNRGSASTYGLVTPTSKVEFRSLPRVSRRVKSAATLREGGPHWPIRPCRAGITGESAGRVENVVMLYLPDPAYSNVHPWIYAEYTILLS